MSLNTANTPDGRGILIFNGEVILVFAQAVSFSLKQTSITGLDGCRTGTVYLTSHRIVFMPDSPEELLKSFEMAFSVMQDVNLEQPIFGANYLRGMATAMPGSQLPGQVLWTMKFNKGGCIDFGHALLDAVDRAARLRPSNAPPPYVPPSGDFYAAPPDYYAPNAASSNPFSTPSAFPARPNPDNVFMCEAPPPYPGIGAERPPQPTEELVVAGQVAGRQSDAPEGLRRRH